MKTYYKVIFIGNVWQSSLFATAFNIRGLVDLPAGRRFFARESASADAHSQYAIESPVPLIHFCDNAVDALLWRDVFGHERYVFTVRPISPVVKSVCNDKNGLYQCGAPGIELVRIIKEGDLEKLAQREIQKNPTVAITRYRARHIQNRIRDLGRGAR